MNRGEDPTASASWTCPECKVVYNDTLRKRRGPDGPRTLCNKCGLRFYRRERKLRRKEEVQAPQTPAPSNVVFVPQPLPVYQQWQMLQLYQQYRRQEQEHVRMTEQINQLRNENEQWQMFSPLLAAMQTKKVAEAGSALPDLFPE